MKKVIIIGGSGFVGSAIMKELLYRDYETTVVVRNADKITIQHPKLNVLVADVSTESTVKNVVEGYDSVISAYNPGWDNPNLYNEILKVYPMILEGVKEAGVKRFLVVGNAGTLFSAPDLRMMNSKSFPESVMPGVRSLREFYRNILKKEEEIDWVFFSPAVTMSNGVRTGKFRIDKGDLIVDEYGNSNISVEDYAVAMVNEVENPQHHREKFTIGY